MADPSSVFTSEFCNQEIPTGPQDAILCNAPAHLHTESGPRCNACFGEYGGTLVAQSQTDVRPSTPLRVRTNEHRFALIGNGLLVRVGKRGAR